MARLRTRQPKPRDRLIPRLLVVMGLFLVIGLYVVRDGVVVCFERLTPVRYVRIEGPFDGIEPGQIEGALQKVLHASFLTVDLQQVETVVRGVPWVRSVKVSRVWPDTLAVELEELQPYARWGHDRLVAATGEVFDRPSSHLGFDSLVLLDGPLGREQEVIAMQQQLEQRFAARGDHLVALALSGRLAWTATLQSGLEIRYGSQNPMAATDRLLSLLPKIAENRDQIMASVDLRYPRGLAISWKSLPPADSKGPKGKLQTEPKNG